MYAGIASLMSTVRYVNLSGRGPHHVRRRVRQMAMQRARELGLTKHEWERIRIESAYARPHDADTGFLMVLDDADMNHGGIRAVLAARAAA